MSEKRRKKSRDIERAGGVLDAQAVLKVFRERQKPLDEKEVLRGLGLKPGRRQMVRNLIDDLVEDGRLIAVKRAWGLVESMNLVTGELEMQRSGVGYVLPDDRRRKDIFIHPKDLGDAWHGDRVVAAVTRERKGGKNEGRIARIIERGVKILPCRVVKRMGQDLYLCKPTDPRHQAGFMVDAPAAAGGGAGLGVDDIINVAPGDRLDYRLYAGTGLEVLGAQDDVSVQEKLVKANHEIPTVFPDRVLAAAENLPDVPGEADFAGRVDLRALPFVTIDGAKARDFDDAIYVEKNRSGFKLWVAIADVAHYVPEGGELDAEARERGNSYYFPQSVEPMFPERLSNGLCSLNPNLPRLAMVAEMEFSNKGVEKKSAFYAAVIDSKARLTYSQVNRALFLDDQAERAAVKAVLPMLEKAEKLARALHAMRRDRGNLDFDLPEPEILFNLNGETVDIRPKARHFGHQIVEECMIAANESVARFLSEKGVPMLYRVHPDPDPAKLENLHKLLSITDLGPSLPKAIGPEDLPKVLELADGTDIEFLVNRMTLRCMMQASYSPKNEGHYGLGSACYGHFTSPIRRYADLAVHRALKLTLAGKGDKAASVGRLQKLGEHLSKRERVAMEAEREILKRVTVLFLGDKVGQRFTGVIGSMADFGFWVELREVMAEGMIRLSTLSDDYYTFFPERQELLGQRTGRRFHLGQTIAVELQGVDIGRLEVNLALVDEGRAKPGAAGGQGARPGKPKTEGRKRPRRRRR